MYLVKAWGTLFKAQTFSPFDTMGAIIAVPIVCSRQMGWYSRYNLCFPLVFSGQNEL